MSNWQPFIQAAVEAGYGVHEDEEAGWCVTTPKAPRKPSQVLGGFKSELAAWKSAAFLRHQDQ